MSHASTGAGPISRPLMKITVDYSRHEDRLRVIAMLQNGEVMALWLTQRLTNMLVKALVDLFDRTLDVPEPEPGRSVAPSARAAAQYWQQTRADLERKPASPPPKPAAPPAEKLVEGLRLRQRGGTYILHFTWGNEAVFLPADETWLRQFMRILHSKYGEAGWPIAGLWPMWFGKEAHRTLVKEHEIN